MQVADVVFVYVCVDSCEDDKRRDVKLSGVVMHPKFPGKQNANCSLFFIVLCSESVVWSDRRPCCSLFCAKVKLQPLVCTHCVLSRGELQGALNTAVILGFSPYKL